jgi:hypothetical protein
MRKADRIVLHLFLVGALASTGAMGCGPSVPMGQVTGKVTYNSQPVKDGVLTFAPAGASSKDTPRRPGTAEIKDGSFTASTESPGDGLGIGAYDVTFTAQPPVFEAVEWDGTGSPPVAPKSEYDGLVPKDPRVEVKEGPNELNIELVAPAQ